jgi:hypothetical protein
MATHEEWEYAKAKRDNAAYRTVRYLNVNEIEAAKAAAAESKSFDDEMERIAKELDR